MPHARVASRRLALAALPLAAAVGLLTLLPSAAEEARPAGKRLALVVGING